MFEKKCSKCKEIKYINNFTKNKNSDDGYDWICKECRKIINREYYKKTSDKKKKLLKKNENKLIIDILEKKGFKHGDINKQKLKSFKWNFIDYPSQYLIFSLSHEEFVEKYNLNIDEYIYLRGKIISNQFKIF